MSELMSSKLGAKDQDVRKEPPNHLRFAITTSGDQRAGVGYVKSGGQPGESFNAGLRVHVHDDGPV